MENETKYSKGCHQHSEKSHRRGKIAGGILLVIIGGLFLGEELGANIPDWIFTWEMLLISFGLVGGIKSGFRSFKWLIPIVIGGAFLLSRFYPTIFVHSIIWPVILIFIGLVTIFRPHRNKHAHFKKRMRDRFHQYHEHSETEVGGAEFASSEEERLDFTTFMGGVRKNVVSKNFKGGDVSNVFGGTEINLSQADFEGKIILEITNVFGGTKLIVPAHWIIASELTSVLGNIDDKRAVKMPLDGSDGKILVLKGTVFMGGIEILSY